MTARVPAPVDDKRAADLAHRVRLVDLSLFEVSACFAGPQDKSGSLSYEVAPATVLWVRDGSTVRAAFPFVIAIRLMAEDADGKDASHELAEVRANFRIEYAFSDDDDEITNEQLRHFVGVSGYMHLWPYVRTEVQHLTAKIGLPPLMLPLIVSGQVPERVTVGDPVQAADLEPVAAKLQDSGGEAEVEPDQDD